MPHSIIITHLHVCFHSCLQLSLEDGVFHRSPSVPGPEPDVQRALGMGLNGVNEGKQSGRLKAQT